MGVIVEESEVLKLKAQIFDSIVKIQELQNLIKAEQKHMDEIYKRLRGVD